MESVWALIFVCVMLALLVYSVRLHCVPLDVDMECARDLDRARAMRDGLAVYVTANCARQAAKMEGIATMACVSVPLVLFICFVA